MNGTPRQDSLPRRPGGAISRVTTALVLGTLAIGGAPAVGLAQGTTQSPAPAASLSRDPTTLTYVAAAVGQKPVLLDPDRLAAAIAMLRRDSLLPPATYLQFVVDVNGRIDTSRLRTTFSNIESSSVERAEPEFLAVRFQPGTLDGVPVRTEVGVPVRMVDGRPSPLMEQGTWNRGVNSLPRFKPSSARKSRKAGEGRSQEVDVADAKVPPRLLNGPVDVAEADVPPRLLNGPEAQRALERLYPPALRDAGVMGQTVIKFVVDAEGRTNPGSLVVISTSHPDFAGASAAVVATMRFRPAMLGGRPVPVLVAIPIGWTLERARPPR
ncbi:MAG: energy transducer TonB [Longimicrobiaceae bacterium]